MERTPGIAPDDLFDPGSGGYRRVRGSQAVENLATVLKIEPAESIRLPTPQPIETLQRLGRCDVLLVADAKELVSRVADLPADAGIDPASELQIDQQLGRLAEALTRRDEILAVLR